MLKKLGAKVVESGQHLKAHIQRGGQSIYPVVVFPKDQPPLRVGTKKAILRSLGLTERQFVEFFSCRLDSDSYFELRSIDKAEDWKKQAVSIPVLVDPSGNPIGRGTKVEKKLVLVTHELQDDLIDLVRDEPNMLFHISSREFEMLVNGLLQKSGYSTTLTHPIRDGGKDVIVATSGILGNFLILVECKQYAPSNPVGVNLVRELYGVVESENATAGMLVTTSSFTKGARELQKKREYRLSLKDYIDLIEWTSSVA